MRLASDSLLLYGPVRSAAATDTPLASFAAQLPVEGDELVLVRMSLIRDYQRVIFELEQQVLQYAIALRQLKERVHRTEETVPEMSPPIDAVSVRVLNSVLRAAPDESSILRAYEEE